MRLPAASLVGLLLVAGVQGCQRHDAGRPDAGTPSTSRPSATSSTPSGGSSALVDGGYGFLVPAGWAKQPLANAGGPASVASFRDPHSSARIDYVENGGSAGVLYDAGDRPVVQRLEDLAQCDHVTSHVVLGKTSVAYACAEPRRGFEVNGVIVVRPYPEGYVDLLVTLPTSQHATATKILNSLKRG